MNRSQLEHLLRAAGAVTGSDRIVVIGSQAILGAYPAAPAELLVSMEAGMWPEDAPGKAELIEGSIGELSPFHETFGYFAHGVAPETAMLARGWRTRAIELKSGNTRGVTGVCLSPADLAVSKIAAGRLKDTAFVTVMLDTSIVTPAQIRELAEGLPEVAARAVARFLDTLAR
jgi:hypothetical protein